MKIVDLSCDVAGRFAAKLFAMAGVEVVRSVVGASEREALDIYLDAHKLLTPCEPAAAKALAATADLVFTSFDHGAWQGLAADGLELPAACVQVTTSTFGTWGPYAALRGGPMAEWSAGGYLAITGEPDRAPLIGPERLCGYVAGYTAAIAAEAALYERRRTGLGQHVDISTIEAMLCVHQSTFARLASGLGRRRTGRYTEVYPLVVRPCRDGYVSLGVVTDAEFDRLAIALGRPELTVDPRFADVAARWANRDALDVELDGFLSGRDCEEVVAVLRANGVAVAKVDDALEALANPQLAHRRFWERPLGPAGPLAPGNPVPAATVFGAPSEPTPRGLQDWAKGLAAARGDLPLAGTVVLDFTAFWAGPSATRNLADFGATVIKVERPGSRVDLEDGLADPEVVVMHLYHCKMNRNKLSLELDLNAPEGRDLARRLANQADILVENFRPGVARRLGLDPAELCRTNPALVYVSLSGFGAEGPWGDLPSYGPTIEAASSIEDRTGYAGAEPLRLGHTLPDGVGGLIGTLAALRGLRERAARGVGGWFDLSQFEAYVALSGEEILAASRAGRAPARIGNRSRTGAIQGVFPCRGADEWLALRLEGADDVARFAAVAGRPDFRALALAVPRDDDALEAMIADFTRDQDRREAAARLQATGLEAIAVLTPEDLVADPHLRVRGFFVEGALKAPLPGSPFHGDRRMADSSGPAPRMGEHGAQVRQALAGIGHPSPG